MTVAPIPDPARRPGLKPDAAATRVAELFERHGQMVYGVCSAMLRHVHDAEDATQQVFLSAHRALLSGTRVRDAGAWLATIARNECRSRIATAMRTPLSVGEDDLETIAAQRDEAERRIQADALRNAVSELPERQREAVVLRYLYGLRYGEVAKALGLSRPATEALLFRARRTMRVRLRPVVGAVLVVPLAVREELAAAIPGFAASTGTSAAAAGAAGGLLAKLTAGPAGAKVAATAIAVSTVGTVGAVGPDRSGRDASSRAPIVASVDVESSSDDDSDSQGKSSREAENLSRDDDRSGSGGRNDLDDDRVLMARDNDEREGQEDANSSGSGSGADDEIESGGSSDSSGNSSSGDDERGGEAEHESSDTDSSGSGSEGSGDTESGHGEESSESSESSESESDSEDSESGEGP